MAKLKTKLCHSYKTLNDIIGVKFIMFNLSDWSLEIHRGISIIQQFYWGELNYVIYIGEVKI